MTSSSLDFIRRRQIQQTMLMLQFVHFFLSVGINDGSFWQHGSFILSLQLFHKQNYTKKLLSSQKFPFNYKDKVDEVTSACQDMFFFIIIHRPWLLLETKSGRIVFMSQRFAKATQIRIKMQIRARQTVCPPRQQMFTHSINEKSKYIIVFQWDQAFILTLLKSDEPVSPTLVWSVRLGFFSVVWCNPHLLPTLMCSTCVCLPSLLSTRQHFLENPPRQEKTK